MAVINDSSPLTGNYFLSDVTRRATGTGANLYSYLKNDRQENHRAIRPDPGPYQSQPGRPRSSVRFSQWSDGYNHRRSPGLRRFNDHRVEVFC